MGAFESLLQTATQSHGQPAAQLTGCGPSSDGVYVDSAGRGKSDTSNNPGSMPIEWAITSVTIWATEICIASYWELVLMTELIVTGSYRLQG